MASLRVRAGRGAEQRDRLAVQNAGSLASDRFPLLVPTTRVVTRKRTRHVYAWKGMLLAGGGMNGRTESMTAAAKLKVSLTLSADVLALVDRDARRGKGSRSSIVEQWLRRAASSSVEQEIGDATAAYYRSLRGEDRTEDESLSRSLSDAARRVARGRAARR